MQGLDNLNLRLSYAGGNQEGRMQADKLKSLKKALLYSYQAATAILQDGREFKCLINPDKNRIDYEDKIISIPYRDICLNNDNNIEEDINLKVGDIFIWKETNTYWLIYLENIEEDAYFRAEIRRCNSEIEINGNKYKIYVRGPQKNDLVWNSKRDGVLLNDMNYDLKVYITKNEETEAFFHRFTKVYLKGKPWEVVSIDNITSNGIITVYLKETFSNSIEDEVNKNKKPDVITDSKISGDTIVYPYDIKEYSIVGETSGSWSISNTKKAEIISQTDTSIVLEIITGKSGEFNLIYNVAGKEPIVLPIVIKSL